MGVMASCSLSLEGLELGVVNELRQMAIGTTIKTIQDIMDAGARVLMAALEN
jgi:hypothetical protein